LCDVVQMVGWERVKSRDFPIRVVGMRGQAVAGRLGSCGC
jgi:hypothetical protein